MLVAGHSCRGQRLHSRTPVRPRTEPLPPPCKRARAERGRTAPKHSAQANPLNTSSMQCHSTTAAPPPVHSVYAIVSHAPGATLRVSPSLRGRGSVTPGLRCWANRRPQRRKAAQQAAPDRSRSQCTARTLRCLPEPGKACAARDDDQYPRRQTTWSARIRHGAGEVKVADAMVPLL